MNKKLHCFSSEKQLTAKIIIYNIMTTKSINYLFLYTIINYYDIFKTLEPMI